MQEQPSEPPVTWAPEPGAGTAPRDGEPVGDLHDHKSPSTFTLTDAIKTGIGLVGKPSFIVPVLVIGIIVNGLVFAVLDQLIPVPIPPGPGLGSAQIETIIGALVPTFIIALVGGIVMSLYGQVWAVDASAGPFPSPARVFGLAARRWAGVIGVGLLVGLLVTGIWVGLVALLYFAEEVIGGLAVVLLMALFVVGIWVSARLSMAGWLAAEGQPILGSIRGSWRITQRSVGRIVGWSVAYGLLFGMLAFVLGELLSVVPYVGSGVTEAISTALGYGAGVTLYRRTQAEAPLG